MTFSVATYALLAGARPSLADWLSFGVGDGLPSNNVGVVQEDQNGEYWIASGSALVRYDAARWFVYDHTNSPLGPGDSVIAIRNDHRGELWIGTRDSGLLMLDAERARWRAFPGISLVSSGTKVQAIVEDHANTLWFGTNAGIVSLDSTRTSWRTYDAARIPQMSNEDIQAIIEDTLHNLWFAAPADTILLLDSTRTFWSALPKGCEDAPLQPAVRGLMQDTRGRVWVVGADRACIYLPASGAWDQIGALGCFAGGCAEFSGIAEGPNGDIWIGERKTYDADSKLQDGGAIRIRGDSIHVVPQIVMTADGLASDDVVSVFCDAEGALWFGTTGGLSRLGGETAPQWTTYTSPLNYIHSVLVDNKGNVWAGVNGFARIFDGVNWSRWVSPVEGIAATAMFQDADGYMWISWDGAGVITDRPPPVSCNSDFYGRRSIGGTCVQSFHQDHRGRVWMGVITAQFCVGGAAVYDTTECGEPVQVDSLKGLGIWDIAEDRAYNYWFATDRGLWSADSGLTRWTRYRAAGSGLPSDDVRALLEDSQGNLWVGTHNAGAARLDPTRGTWSGPYTTMDGLGSNDVRQIVEDRTGHLWFATSTGLTRFDGKQWGTYTSFDGMVGNDVRGIATEPR